MPSRHHLPLAIAAAFVLAGGAARAFLPSQADADARALVMKLRALRDQASTDATVRLLVTAPGDARLVRTLRVRARAIGDEFKTLVEVRDAASVQGRILIVQAGTAVHVESWHRHGPPVGPAGDTDAAVRWISPCLQIDDLSDAHLWWPAQSLIRRERVGDRSAVVLESRLRAAGSAPYAVVTDWIDAERLVPLRTEKASADGKPVATVAYDRVRQREGRWAPGRVVIMRPERGCRVELTALSGTIRASIPVTAFDPGGLAEVR
jgi:hypothetical protein